MATEPGFGQTKTTIREGEIPLRACAPRTCRSCLERARRAKGLLTWILVYAALWFIPTAWLLIFTLDLFLDPAAIRGSDAAPLFWVGVIFWPVALAGSALVYRRRIRQIKMQEAQTDQEALADLRYDAGWQFQIYRRQFLRELAGEEARKEEIRGAGAAVVKLVGTVGRSAPATYRFRAYVRTPADTGEKPLAEIAPGLL